MCIRRKSQRGLQRNNWDCIRPEGREVRDAVGGTTLEGGGIWRGTITYHHISDQDNQSWGTHFNSERRRTKQNYIWHSPSPLFNNIWWKIPYFCTTKSWGYFAKHLTIFVPGQFKQKLFIKTREGGKLISLKISKLWVGWLCEVGKGSITKLLDILRT